MRTLSDPSPLVTECEVGIDLFRRRSAPRLGGGVAERRYPTDLSIFVLTLFYTLQKFASFDGISHVKQNFVNSFYALHT